MDRAEAVVWGELGAVELASVYPYGIARFQESWSSNELSGSGVLTPCSGSRGGTLPKRNSKGTEPSLALPAREGGMSSATGAPQLPGEEGDRSQEVWQWMLESERQSKSKPHR